MLPQLILIALHVLGFGLVLEKHGEPKQGKHDARSLAVGLAIIHGLLYWGGFYSELIRRLS